VPIYKLSAPKTVGPLRGHICPEMHQISPTVIFISTIFPWRNPLTPSYRGGEGEENRLWERVKGFLLLKEGEGRKARDVENPLDLLLEKSFLATPLPVRPLKVRYTVRKPTCTKHRIQQGGIRSKRCTHVALTAVAKFDGDDGVRTNQQRTHVIR